MDKSNIHVYSEIGKLEGVILHRPGPEVENMTPASAERALYSDILNLSIAKVEYAQLEGILNKVTKTFQVKDLLIEILNDKQIKYNLIKSICESENVPDIQEELLEYAPGQLAGALIEGLPLINDNLTKYLSGERYSLLPLPNFFFTRDAVMSIFDKVFIGKMANRVREREAMIMESIFTWHPKLKSPVINANHFKNAIPEIKFEGGDVLVAREDILIIGVGLRTSSQAIDFFIDYFKEATSLMNIIIQELPHTPESFIHLDMAFTILDKDSCMVFSPLILNDFKFRTVHIAIENGKVKKIATVPNIVEQLKALGMDLKPLACGGEDDIMFQEREQWHSGANFFALEPGKVITYSRNIKTSELLNKNGYEIVSANTFIQGNLTLSDYEKVVITIDGSELSRGGGGARCMTMPIRRGVF